MTAAGSIENVYVTCGAAVKSALPAWSALMAHEPAATNATAPSGVTVQAVEAVLNDRRIVADRAVRTNLIVVSTLSLAFLFVLSRHMNQ